MLRLVITLVLYEYKSFDQQTEHKNITIHRNIKSIEEYKVSLYVTTSGFEPGTLRVRKFVVQ